MVAGMWWFIGCEMVPLAAEEVVQPRKNIAKGCVLLASARVLT